MDFDTIFSEIVDKMVEGEKVSIEEYCRDYPQYKERLLAKLRTAQ